MGVGCFLCERTVQCGMSDSDDGGIEPVSDGRTITFKPKILNEFLTCSICRGYYREPVTVRECLHTFCKSCIYKYIVDNFGPQLSCPDCNVALGSRPFESVKEDCVLQELVIKIFPQVFDKDKEDERRFYEYIGKPLDEPEPPTIGKRQNMSEMDSPPKAKKPKTGTDVQIKLVFEQKGAKDPKFKSLPRPVLTLSTSATILHLKKFIKEELKLNGIDNIDILFNGEVLGAEHSLEYVLKTRGDGSSSGATFTFQQRV